MLSSTLKTSVSRSNFHKTSKFSYSVWRSVKNEHAFDSSTKLACQNGVQKVLINFQCSPYIKNCSVNSRLVSTSVTRYKEPSSKVEETVERLKEKKKGDADTLETKILSESKEVDHAKKKSVWVSVKNVFKHYYSGFRLLFLDVKVSSKIVYKITRGKPLTRRESRQLVRTTSVGFNYWYSILMENWVYSFKGDFLDAIMACKILIVKSLSELQPQFSMSTLLFWICLIVIIFFFELICVCILHQRLFYSP